MRARALIWTGLLLLAGCSAPPAEGPVADRYFDLKGFLDGQRTYLESVSPTVEKTVRAGSGAAETLRMSRVNWERELAFFYEADINKPALRGAYTEVVGGLPDGGTRRTYLRRAGEPGTVKRVVVDLGEGGGVRQVRVEQDDRNMLFSSSRLLTLQCDPVPDRNRLMAYSIEGRQKLIFFDETHYEVKAEVE